MTLTDTQEQILDATIACIARDGVDGTSLRNVAREADVSLGLLGYHFDDKGSLIVAAFQRATDRLTASMDEALDGVDGADERVQAYIRGAFDDQFLEPDFLALWIAVWAVARIDIQVAAVESSMCDPYASNLATLIQIARPSLTATQATERATDAIVIQNGLWLNWARGQERTVLQRGLDLCDAIALAP